MNTTIACRGKRISVRMNLHAIRIVSDSELWALLASDTRAATVELTANIKASYAATFNQRFAVSDASFVVEIWGHLYAEKFAKIIKQISPVHFVNKIADKVIYHCKLIDIGEKGHDDNRFVWDSLAPMHAVIALFLPRKKR